MPVLTPLEPMAPWMEIHSTEDDWTAVGRDGLLRMLLDLHIVRTFEETVLNLAGMGIVHGPAHSSIGQEGGAVGAIAPLRDGDQVSGSHRGHHQFLAKALRYVDQPGFDPFRNPVPDRLRSMVRRTLAEIMGLSEGYCKGRGGSMHLRWPEAGAQGTNAIVGGGVPFANGLAWAKKRRGQGDVVYTFFGDGAVNIGSVPESLNLAAVWKLPICFFIENNGYAVSTTLEEETLETRLSARGLAYGIPAFRVDGMDPVAVRLASEHAVALMRAGEGPAIIEAIVYRYGHHSGPMQGSAFGYRSKQEEAEWRHRDPLRRTADEMITRGWLTPAQDHELHELARRLMGEAVEALTEPTGNQRVIRPGLWPDIAFTDAGLRGDLSEFNGISFVEENSFKGPMEEKKFVDVISEVMAERMETDSRIFVLGEDIHKLRGGLAGATRGLPERFPDRILATPIAEAGFSGLAGGVAMEGTYRPVVELMFPDFALVAADQLFNQIGKARHMFGGDTAMPLVVRTRCAIGMGYGSQHSMDPAGLFAQWPGWRIVAPSTPFDYVGLMNSALRCEDPVLVIEHADLYQTKGHVPSGPMDFHVALGRAKVVRRGSLFTVLTYLSMVGLAVSVAEEMGLDAEVIDLRSLDRAGIDWETIEASVRKTNSVVILEQGSLTISYGSLLDGEIQRRCFDWLDQPVHRIHGRESSPSVSKVLERAAVVGVEEIRKHFATVVANMGDRSRGAA